MKPRAGNQRGIIFTLSVLLLALAVVGLAQTINEKTKDAADNISYANAAHAVANRFDNSREDLRKLVEKKAFELYDKRGRKPGHSLEDWLEAERIIKGRLSK